MKFSIIATVLFSLASAVPAPAVTPAAQLEKRQSSDVTVNGVGIGLVSAARVRESFTASGVVPTLIPSIVPVAAIQATYGNKQVDLGNRFNIPQTVNHPTVVFTRPLGDDPAQKYSLFLIDPDVPGPNTEPRANYLLWYVSGIGGPNKATVTLYQSPAPVSTGQHRFTFLVYREPPGYQPDVLGAQVRAGFDLSGYTSRGFLGKPVAGNFFNESVVSV